MDVKITVLHCVSSYPAKIKDCNLNSIKYLSKKLNWKLVGQIIQEIH